jgi:ParB-like chromosome segregation protein Spo0J
LVNDGVPGLKSRHRVPIAELAGSFSPRIGGENEEHASLLAEMEEPLPPVVVHRATMRIVDGLHRVRAARLRGEEFIDAMFCDGSEDDAFVLAVDLNRAHGLPLSTADRKAAAFRIVSSHPGWSDRRIAAVTGLAASTIGSIRERSTDRFGQLNARIGQDGRTRPRDSAAGRRRAADLMLSDPAASIRQIAKAAGISPATASDVRARLVRGQPPTTSSQRRTDEPAMTGTATVRSRAEPEHEDRKLSSRTANPSVDSADSPIPLQRSQYPGVLAEQRDDTSPAKFIAALVGDPSLRFTEAGRALLRFLGCVSVDQRQWEDIAQSIPSHQRAVVVSLARECATVWERLAERLERCSDDVSSQGLVRLETRRPYLRRSS